MSLFSLLSVSASGMSAQRTRAELLVENLANAVFTTQAADSPFSSIFESQLGRPEGVAVSEVVVDDRAPERRYLPGHPDADKDGYVAFPRINPAEDMVDLMGATRGYQANIAAISSVKDMIQRSIDLIR